MERMGKEEFLSINKSKHAFPYLFHGPDLSQHSQYNLQWPEDTKYRDKVHSTATQMQQYKSLIVERISRVQVKQYLVLSMSDMH